MRDEFRLGRHRGKWVAIQGRGVKKQRHSLGLAARPASKAEAQRLVRDLNLARGRATVGTNATVATVWAAYIADREYDNVPSVFRMKQAWKPLEPHFGHLQPDQIDKDACRKYIAKRRALGVSNGGIKTELDYLSTALRFGKQQKLYSGERPEITRPPAGRPRERWLTRAEAQKLVAGAQAFHIKLFILLSLSTAGRPSHILQLTWDRVDMQGRVVNLDDPNRDATRKGRAKVPINDMAFETLTMARQVAETAFVVEYNGEGGLKRVNKGVMEAARRARVKGVTPYVLRHTAGVWMAQDGVPMEQISQFMGHTTTAVTERVYARFHPEYLRRAAGALQIGNDAPMLEGPR